MSKYFFLTREKCSYEISRNIVLFLLMFFSNIRRMIKIKIRLFWISFRRLTTWRPGGWKGSEDSPFLFPFKSKVKFPSLWESPADSRVINWPINLNFKVKHKIKNLTSDTELQFLTALSRDPSDRQFFDRNLNLPRENHNIFLKFSYPRLISIINYVIFTK